MLQADSEAKEVVVDSIALRLVVNWACSFTADIIHRRRDLRKTENSDPLSSTERDSVKKERINTKFWPFTPATKGKTYGHQKALNLDARNSHTTPSLACCC